MDDAALAARALEAKQRAYAPYSKFRVGAALLAADGSCYSAANLENASLGLSVCAERNAVAQAVSAGRRSFLKIAIASDGDTCVPPCGACRQVLREFCEDLDVLLVDPDGSWRSLRLSELFPEAFVGYAGEDR